MSVFDTVLIVIWAGFIFYGLFFGLIRMIGNFLGLIIGIFIASRLYLSVFAEVGGVFGSYEALGKIVVFLILFSIFSKLVSFGFVIFEKMFKLVSIIPFVKSFNRLGGLILGFFVGGIIIGLVLFLSTKHFITGSITASLIESSQVAPFLLYLAKIVSPLLPEAVKALKSLI